MGDALAAGIREDFPEEAAEEQGENTQWTCSPCIPVLGLFRRSFLQWGQDRPATVPALGPH